MATEAAGVDRAANGVGIRAEFSRKGADLPGLGMKQMTDWSDLLIGITRRAYLRPESN